LKFARVLTILPLFFAWLGEKEIAAFDADDTVMSASDQPNI